MDPIDPFRRRPSRPTIHATPHRTRADERAAQLDTSPATLAAEVERLTRERDAALRKAREAEAAAAAPAGTATKAAKAADRAELEAATKARDEYLAALQRERAEFLNFKRRTAEEREASLGLAAVSLIRKVLALADDFDRAIETRPGGGAPDPWAEGIAAIDRKLRQLLESEGVTPIEATRGMAFDPRDHEAVASVPGTGLPDGQVVEELRRGYRLRDRVIRPALVAVAQEASPETVSDATDNSPEPRIH
ncbi:MAG TPA: nucleotide exchange factor GrpE [Candidatus Limnocylindrales bacterium]|nr:nucleotide exchange factor GrpE [Candidatus Limnocylindrales bacterium]